MGFYADMPKLLHFTYVPEPCATHRVLAINTTNSGSQGPPCGIGSQEFSATEGPSLHLYSSVYFSRTVPRTSVVRESFAVDDLTNGDKIRKR